MRTTTIALAGVLAAALLASAAPAEDEGPAPQPADGPPPKRTVLVELFTSQG